MAKLLRWGIFFATLCCGVAVRADLLVLYPGSPGFGAVGRFDAATGAAGAAFGHDNEGMFALCVDARGDVYVSADLVGYGLIYRFDRAGRFLGKIADVDGVDFTALTSGPDGLLYAIAFVAEPADRAVRHAHVVRFPRDAPAATIFVSEGTLGMNAPRALGFGPDGHLYVADAEAGVLRFDGATGAALDVFVPPGRGGLADAAALAFGGDGRLYVASVRANAVLRFDALIGTFVDTFASGLSGPRGLAFGAEGDLYVSNTGANQVLRYDGQTGILRGALAGDPAFRSPTALAFQPALQRAVPLLGRQF
jgi:hypothetical protein